MEYLINTFYYVIPFIIILGVLVFVHEFGHFIVARLFGVKVDEFSIGFGKRLFGWKDKKGTDWKVCLLPLGGYVKMFGDENAASANTGKKAKKLTKAEQKIAFEFKHPLKKMAIVFAGPFFNYLFAAIIFSGIFFFVGKVFYPPVVGDVIPNSPASEVGIIKGDRIVSVDGVEVASFSDIKKHTSMSVNEITKFVIQRGDKKINMDVKMREILPCMEDEKCEATEKRKMLGVMSTTMTERPLVAMSFGQSIKEGIVKTWDLSAMTLKGVGQMIVGKRSGDEIGGIIRIAEMSGDVSKSKSIESVLTFVALLSVNLGLINLFPIPVLDGGHIVIYAIEIVTRKKVSDKVKEWLAKFGFAIIMALLIFATYNDIARFFK